MAEEKSFLQSVKLEISRSFKLVPYERLAFHRILGILKTDIGMGILLKDLERGPDIRRSAIETLIEFDHTDVLAGLTGCLSVDISDDEKLMILDHLKRRGGGESVKGIIGFIETCQEGGCSPEVLARAFEVLGIIGAESDEVLNFLTGRIQSERLDRRVRSLAIEALSSFRSVPVLETILKKNDDDFSYGVYKVVYVIAAKLADQARTHKSEDDRLYTYAPDSEDKILLEVRVLLGKMTHAFDSYSTRTKIAFICAMIACNHREYLIYAMKALTSGDIGLVSMMLHSIYQNVERLRDPDKLFRNLIAISTEVERFNEMIVDIFVRYFSNPSDTRTFHLLRDKLYSYIVVTLETYFETYRKEFMITDVIEKGLPEDFQRIRKFILGKCTPDLKKEIIAFLTRDDPAMVKHIITSMGKRITYLEGQSVDDLALLVEMLMDRDRKSRENSASRIEDLNFEKLYLRNRIIRLCRIIGFLHIEEAASVMVNIYNYLKKYPDREILDATVHALSMLNYSYMLGEIEVMLTTGTDEEQMTALRLISLFTEQRSLNILLELLKNRIAERSPIIESALSILLERDIAGNITANQIFKTIIASNPPPLIRGLAILGVGQCGSDADIEYLNDLFYHIGQDESKDVIVRAIASIIARNPGINKRQLMRHLQEYLKDPGIRVRIYSCLLLAQMDNRDAVRSIRDMLIIKNKGIQRDILTILGGLKSIEFAFFLLSLLKEEYGISRDIIAVIAKLPAEDMKEIDAFVVNIFRKYEAPAMEGVQSQPAAGSIAVDGMRKERKTVLNISLVDEGLLAGARDIPGLIALNLHVKSLIASAIQERGGAVTRMSHNGVVAFFDDASAAAAASVAITAHVSLFNETRIAGRSISLFTQLITEEVKIIGDEIVCYPFHMVSGFANLPVKNKIVVDEETVRLVGENFSVREIPHLALSVSGIVVRLFEIIAPINFMQVSEKIVRALREEDEKRDQLQQQIEAELKKIKRERRTATSVEIARGLDDLAHKLQGQLDEIDRYVQKRSTDRELIKNVRRMLTNVHNLYKVEISRLIID